jgi:signal transduction histidine kinase
MKIVNTSLALLFISVLLLSSSCGSDEYTSVASISESWLEAKISIINRSQNTEDNSIEKIDIFIGMFNQFFASSLGTLYGVYLPREIHSFEKVPLIAEQLKVSIQNQQLCTNSHENDAYIFSLILEIDNSLHILQKIDTQFSDTSQIHYFYMFLFFAILVIIIIVVMSILFSRIEKAEMRERRSIRFSRETVMAQEEERSRIARELHDTIAQDLWRLTFQTDSIGKTENAEERNRLCKETVNEERELMKRIRSICDTLIPPDFSRRGLIEALRLLCYHFEQRTNIECNIMIDEPLNLGELESGTQLQCFRIVQECFANIEKHSGAGKASILIKNDIKNEKDDTLSINVEDNGKGFSPPNRDSSQNLKDEGHYGLWSMFERAVLLNGKLTIKSAMGKGTCVTLEVPIFPCEKPAAGGNV